MHSTFSTAGTRLAAFLGALTLALLAPLFTFAQSTTTPGFPSTGVGGNLTDTMLMLGIGALAIIGGIALFVYERKTAE